MDTTTETLAAFAALDDGTAAALRRYDTAADLGVSASTLRSLTVSGLVESTLRDSSLRGGERLAYRLTFKGRTAARA